MQKFENVYFLCTIPEMTPDTYKEMAEENYFLSQVNVLWYVGDAVALSPYEWMYFNGRGQENLAGEDTDELYEALCDKYYPQGEPDMVGADVIFFELDPKTIVYQGVKKNVCSLREEEAEEEPPKEEPVEMTASGKRVRKPRQAALVADPNTIEKDEDEEDEPKEGVTEQSIEPEDE